jgi:hypothetical protein
MLRKRNSDTLVRKIFVKNLTARGLTRVDVYQAAFKCLAFVRTGVSALQFKQICVTSVINSKFLMPLVFPFRVFSEPDSPPSFRLILSKRLCR